MENISTEEENVYFLAEKGSTAVQTITFYKLRPDGSESNGTTLEEVIRVSIERLQDLNSRFGCRENALAITKLEEALMWLDKRTADRITRGVEGKHQL